MHDKMTRIGFISWCCPRLSFSDNTSSLFAIPSRENKGMALSRHDCWHFAQHPASNSECSPHEDENTPRCKHYRQATCSAYLTLRSRPASIHPQFIHPRRSQLNLNTTYGEAPLSSFPSSLRFQSPHPPQPPRSDLLRLLFPSITRIDLQLVDSEMQDSSW